MCCNPAFLSFLPLQCFLAFSLLLIPPNFMYSLSATNMCMDLGLSLVIQGPHPQRKWISPSLSHQLPIDSHLGLGLPDTAPLHAGILSGLILCESCACRQDTRSSISKLCPENNFTIAIHLFWPLQSSCALLQNDPWTLGEGTWHGCHISNSWVWSPALQEVKRKGHGLWRTVLTEC